MWNPFKGSGAGTSCFTLSSGWQTCFLAIKGSRNEDTRNALYDRQSIACFVWIGRKLARRTQTVFLERPAESGQE